MQPRLIQLLLISVTSQIVLTETPASVNIEYQIDQLNNKLDQLQRNLDLFEYYNASGTPIIVHHQYEAKRPPPPQSCREAYDAKIGDGVYKIYLPDSGLEAFSVYCLKDADETEPWTIVQRRVDGSVDFYRDWHDYRKGFGDLNGNFWIGLDKLHALTNQEGNPQELWINLVSNVTAYAKFKEFAIGDEYEQYKLNKLGDYTGTAGDSLRGHLGMKFSTRDADHDTYPQSCAIQFHAAWWYHKCHGSHLNGVYGSTVYAEGVVWNTFQGLYVPMKQSHMAIRPTRSKKLGEKFVNYVYDVKRPTPNSCKDAYDTKIGDGIYKIFLPNSGLEAFSVYCLKEANETEPWTVVQRRVDGSVDFYRGWLDYKQGFGDLSGNFFIGLDKLHALTSKGKPQELWVSLQRDITVFAKYKEFAIGDEYERYQLKTLGPYTGTAGDSLTYHRGGEFSTRDSDNDTFEGSCASEYQGGWWYKKCHECNLNGVYGSTDYAKGVVWNAFKGMYTPMMYAHMAIRPVK